MSKTVFAFGRMNPPTIGHEKLAAKVESEARRRGAMPHIYLSHTQNATKDPLPYNVKITIAKKAFGKAVTTSSAKNIIQIMQELENMGHTEVTLIAGSDRVPEFKTLLGKYNGKEYNFKKINVVSAGERDPDAQGVEGMSASKLRAIAKEGDYDTFAKGMPSKLTDRDKKKVYDTIRSVMEDYDNIDEKMYYAIATKSSKSKTGWRRVPDTKFDTEQSAERYGDKYHTDKYGSKMYKIVTFNEEAPRVPRKKGQPAGSDKHSDLYTDENPKGTIHGLKFATEKDAEASVAKIKSSGKKHAHKIQAAIAMEQRARVAGKTAAASVYRAYINDMKKKTKEMNEAFELKLERDKRAKLLVLHVKDTKTGNRSEVRGKPGYEIDGYDPKDKLHKVLDKIGKSANMSELMNGEKVTINPNHPKGKEAIKIAKEITTEMYEEIQLDEGVNDPTDEELDDILNEIEDDDLFWEWDEDDDFELDLDEAPLTMQQRMKRRLLMKRLAPRIARKRALKMKKRAGKDQLVKRSRRAALLLLKKKVAGDKGKNYKELSPSEKSGIDRLVQKRLPMVGKIAKRLLPKMTKKETERMRNRSKTNESFELFIERKVAQDPDVDERPGTQPKKYFSGVRKKSKEARAKHFERGAKMDDDNPAAYTKAPGDAEGKTKPSKHTKKFKQMFGEKVEYLEEKQIDALKKKSEKTGIPYGILKQVYNRGMAAWRTGHRPGTTPQQWAFARVNSFATKSKGTWGGADKDLAAKARGSMKKEQVTEADPCWDGYKQVGMKRGASGKMVPNCVPEEVELDEEFKKGDKVIVKVGKSSDRELQQLSKKFGNTVSGVVMGQTGKIVMVKTDKGQINPSVKDVMKEEVELGEADATVKQQKSLKALMTKALGGKRSKPGYKSFIGDNGDFVVADGGGRIVGRIKSGDYKDPMKEEVELDESALIDTKVVKTFPAPKMSGEVIVRKHNKENKFFVRLKYTGKQAKRSRPENLGTFSSLNDAMKAIKKKGISIDEKRAEFETDRDLPNLRRPKGTTDYEFKKFLMKTKRTKSRQKDYFKGEGNIKEREMTDGEKEKLDRLKKKYEKSDMQKSMKDRYGDDGPFYATLTKMAMNKEAVSPAQQAAIAIAKKKSGKYDDEGKKIDEQDAAADAKERHNDEKERLKRKHDRELDAARLRDTRTKNANEAFEALIEEPCCDDCAEDEYGWAEETDFIAIDESAAEYQGRKVKLNNPTRSDNPKKKTMVYVKNEKGNVVKVYFGDPNMSIKRDDPERRKNFRARHNCDNPGPKWKARYWSCKFWSKKPVSKLMKG